MARNLAIKLKNEEDFYIQCSKNSLNNYKECFSEKVYIYNMNKVIKEVMNETN